MEIRSSRFAKQEPILFGNLIAVAVIAAMVASCKPFPPEQASPVPAVTGETGGTPQPSCGPAKPSTRELLVQWISMTRDEIPELNADVAGWIQMTQEPGKPGPGEGDIRPEKVDVEPSAVFGMATITVFPGAEAAGKDDKADAPAADFNCNGLVFHSKINSRVLIDNGSTVTEGGLINLDSGVGYVVIAGDATLKTRVKVEFPGNAFWEPVSEEFVLGDRIHLDKGIRKGESCSVFVLGSEKRDELSARGEPDRAVVPELVTLMQSSPSRYTRGMAAIHLGIVRDVSSLQAMLDAFARETDEGARADIALGLGILGDKSALPLVEEAAKAVTDKSELDWKYREAVNRLKGRRH